jgi:hypothetical protein
MTMKMVAIVLASIALITGIASVIFWWLSSKASFVITTFGHITDADGWVITSRDLEILPAVPIGGINCRSNRKCGNPTTAGFLRLSNPGWQSARERSRLG